MPSDTRARMVEGAATLLAHQGVQATSFAEILKVSGGSRGSIYHHFPGGKTQLVAEAVDLLGELAFAPVTELAGASAEAVTRAFLDLWRSFIDGFELRGGCAILSVTVTTDSPDLIERTAAVFAGWRTRLADLLHQGGLEERHAAGFAVLLISAVEGALVLARAEKSMEPYDLTAEQLMTHLRFLMS
jgi:TetR/AcrR family transcriptional repressor of lmrAB and yxaGH operons